MICGAGVGGLSAGIALRRIGFDVTVFERADELRATGAGLNLWPNAGRALYALGLQAEYDAISVMLRRYLTVSATGDVLYDRPTVNWPDKYGAPATGIPRRALSRMLAESLGCDRILFGHDLVNLNDFGSGIKCTFANGQEYCGDLFVGADGIHSATRKCLYGSFEYRENQYYADRWRGMFRFEDVEADPFAETEVFDENSFFGAMPIGDGYGYWFASGPGIAEREDLLTRFNSWTNTHVPGTIAASLNGEMMQTKLYDLLDPPEKWSCGRATLLGDAAHPMMPDMAQGASQTFVDSMVLGDCMAAAPDVATGLQRYEELRRPEAIRVVHLSRRGMFAEAQSDSKLRKPDPISLRYERDVEGYAAV